MLKSIQVENFRSFEKSGFLDLKPITVYVGLNSSGKSSFLRILPLLRQSIEKKISGPVLWFGDYVDYDSYDASLNRSATTNGITFSFLIDLCGKEITVCITISGEKKQENHISSIKLVLEHSEIELISKNGKATALRQDNVEYKIEGLSKLYSYDYGITPLLSETQGNIPNHFYLRFPINMIMGVINDPLLESVSNDIVQTLKEYVHKNITPNDIHTQILRIVNKQLRSSDDLKILLKKKLRCKSFKKNFPSIPAEKWDKLYKLFELASFNTILFEIKKILTSELKSVRYIAPLRAVTERFYRRQGLQVDEVDPKGENIPMLLKSLSPERKNKFEDWTRENLGFSVTAVRNGGQYEIKVKMGKDEELYNLTDMGFGFSQVIPIVTALWFEIENSNYKKSLIFVIEQPELHLHPGYQGLFSKLICKLIRVAKDKNIHLRFVIETHSEHIINIIGANIEEKVISSEDACVYLFEKKDKITTVRPSKFTEEGYLEDWPYGFFEVNL